MVKDFISLAECFQIDADGGAKGWCTWRELRSPVSFPQLLAHYISFVWVFTCIIGTTSYNGVAPGGCGLDMV